MSDGQLKVAPPSFGAVWPRVDARLRALLAARGEVSQVDDIVQEVAARALEHGVVFTDAADLYPWAATVARNLHISGLRDQARVIPTETIPPRPSTEDVADAVHWRDVWVRALTQIAQMPLQDQTVLLAPLLADASRPVLREPVRTSVRRHRARASLRRRLGGILGTLLPTGICWRLLRRQALAVMSGTAVAVALVIAAGTSERVSKPVRLTPRTQSPTVFMTRARPTARTYRAVDRSHAGWHHPPSTGRGRHLVVQPNRAPGVRVDETHPAGPKPVLCLHGPAVDGLCTPTVPLPRSSD